MFCDLVGSTALSLQLDPEDLCQVIGAYHSCVAQTIGRYDGFVAKYMGDGVLVYFGYPQAHEDDAERAARAGLALVEAVTAIATANRKLLCGSWTDRKIRNLLWNGGSKVRAFRNARSRRAISKGTGPASAAA
jgi:Adenylate and Guanylate cyclase catalytic domain